MTTTPPAPAPAPAPTPVPVPIPTPAPAPVTVQVTGTVTLTLDGVAIQAPFVGTFVMPVAQVVFTADSSVTADSSNEV